MTRIAKGEFVVKLVPLTMDGMGGDGKFARLSIDKVFSGDLVATSAGQMLSAMTDIKGSAGYVAIEKVDGVLEGKKGTFVLQHTGSMNQGAPTLAISVIPDSGTGKLTGLTGQLAIIITDGKHSYAFTYTLP